MLSGDIRRLAGGRQVEEASPRRAGSASRRRLYGAEPSCARRTPPCAVACVRRQPPA